jgi:uncharacterized protein (DUF2342 family)
MSDDLFSKLFELFNQPGPVNLKLAAEISHHLTGERVPVDPWAAEEFRELTRLAEFQAEQASPFPVHAAPDVLPVDAREWADRNLEGFRYLAEPFGNIIDVGALGPAGAIMGQLAPAMVGMQLGTLVGSLGAWVMASFDAGVPVQGDGPITYVVPTIERFTTEHGFDARDVRLWVAMHETVHRAMFRVPFTTDHLVDLLGAAANQLKVSPDKLMDMMQGMDPTQLADGMDPEKLQGLFDCIEHRASSIEHRASSIEHRASSIEHRASSKCPRSAQCAKRLGVFDPRSAQCAKRRDSRPTAGRRSGDPRESPAASQPAPDRRPRRGRCRSRDPQPPA